jgi:hypothetical protein
VIKEVNLYLQLSSALKKTTEQRTMGGKGPTLTEVSPDFLAGMGVTFELKFSE